jgi:hypothetical protein
MPNARSTDPQTSHDAAASVGNITDTKKAIVRILEVHGPLTDPEINAKYNKMVNLGIAPRASESGLRSRRSELVNIGVVEDTGFKQKLESGRNAIIWGKV